MPLQQLYYYLPVLRHRYCLYIYLQSYSHFSHRFHSHAILLQSKLSRAPLVILKCKSNYMTPLPKPFSASSPCSEWKPKSFQRPTKPDDWGHYMSLISYHLPFDHVQHTIAFLQFSENPRNVRIFALAAPSAWNAIFPDISLIFSFISLK